MCVCIGPRDLCVTRHWRQNNDGSFMICLDSTEHTDCPLVDNYVRGILHGVYFISSLREDDDDDRMESMCTFVAQFDPKGWLWEAYGYQKALLRQLMFHVLDIRDLLDEDRFVHVCIRSVVIGACGNVYIYFSIVRPTSVCQKREPCWNNKGPHSRMPLKMLRTMVMA